MQTRSQHEEAKIFANLFAGMTKSFITKDKDNNYETIHREITLEDYQDHIKGNVSIGVEPRDDSSKCRFAMLDFDGHKSNKKDVRPFTKGQIKKIIDKINFLELPLSVFKSNSVTGMFALHSCAAIPLPIVPDPMTTTFFIFIESDII